MLTPPRGTLRERQPGVKTDTREPLQSHIHWQQSFGFFTDNRLNDTGLSSTVRFEPYVIVNRKSIFFRFQAAIVATTVNRQNRFEIYTYSYACYILTFHPVLFGVYKNRFPMNLIRKW